jgi:DNA-binding MarR family transcriptional regulator
MQAQLTARLARELAGDSDLSYPDYAVLVALTDRSDGRCRPFELGGDLGWEKSRVSHHISRMVARGLVRRERCPSDQRGAFVVVTDQGRTAIEAAAPGHVAAVRRYVIDRLSPAQIDALASVASTVLAALGDAPQGDASQGESRQDEPSEGERAVPAGGVT